MAENEEEKREWNEEILVPLDGLDFDGDKIDPEEYKKPKSAYDSLLKALRDGRLEAQYNARKGELERNLISTKADYQKWKSLRGEMDELESAYKEVKDPKKTRLCGNCGKNIAEELTKYPNLTQCPHCGGNISRKKGIWKYAIMALLLVFGIVSYKVYDKKNADLQAQLADKDKQIETLKKQEPTAQPAEPKVIVKTEYVKDPKTEQELSEAKKKIASLENKPKSRSTRQQQTQTQQTAVARQSAARAEAEQTLRKQQEEAAEMERQEKEKEEESNRQAAATTVSLQSATRQYKVGDIITFGSYPFYADGTKKAIDWIILDIDAEKNALVISDYALDSVNYNKRDVDITWENSSIRKWLNKTFINKAFTPEQRSKIINSYVVNKDNVEYKGRGGNDTYDKLFLLSIDEANKYFKSSDDRIAYPTPYAKSKKSVDGNLAVSENDVSTDRGGSCWWWLRSPGYQNTAAAVIYYGDVLSHGIYVNFGHGAVRPALKINLNNF